MNVERPEQVVYWRELLAAAHRVKQTASESAETAPAAGMTELDELGANFGATTDFNDLWAAAVRDVAGSSGDPADACRLLAAAVRTQLLDC